MVGEYGLLRVTVLKYTSSSWLRKEVDRVASEWWNSEYILSKQPAEETLGISVYDCIVNYISSTSLLPLDKYCYGRLLKNLMRVSLYWIWNILHSKDFTMSSELLVSNDWINA